MTMEGYLDERADRADRDRKQGTRDGDTRAWFNQTMKPEVRLLVFDEWLRLHLDVRLEWGWAGDAKERRLEQCRIQIDGMILALWRRGWMLDGQRLADHIKGMLDAIGKAQRGGEVREFWPYFKAAVDRYVGLNAEEIQAEAMSAGSAVGQVFQQLTKRLPAGPTMPELIAQRTQETLTARMARQRRQDSRKTADAAQLPLL